MARLVRFLEEDRGKGPFAGIRKQDDDLLPSLAGPSPIRTTAAKATPQAILERIPFNRAKRGHWDGVFV